MEKGFTLIELSIVLVLVGLIISGVVGGEALIRQAELRSIMTQANGYRVAINTFQLQYDALPGDIPDAWDYWGAACGPNDFSRNGGCNGDGNSYIVGNPPNSSQNEGEALRFWQHLTLAELIPGNYTGAIMPSPVIGVTVPGTKIGNVLFFPESMMLYSTEERNYFSIEESIPGPSNWQSGWLTGGEAARIDRKFDDGLAHDGKIKARDGWSNSAWEYGCLDLTPDPDVYDKMGTERNCVLHVEF